MKKIILATMIGVFMSVTIMSHDHEESTVVIPAKISKAILAILSFASISMLYFYQIDRQTHLDNLEKLERRSSNK